MPLANGARLGPYEVSSAIGAGGMGEVYRARDTRLGRDVALKVLPAALANDADYMARFEREAQVLASLNHPNIATIYGVEESSGKCALAMELVEGPTLEERIRQSPLPLTEALGIAKQIADALEAAHEKGVIHRDLKPANVKVTPDGIVKVLDFGLAKTADATTASGDPVNSPTLTIRATQAGIILGTAGYMAPEQAAGKPVDKRADIWSFGVVLYETLTGKQMFEGETISHTLAQVLMVPIDFNRLPATTPPVIRELLRRCLDRDLKTRLQAIGEARIALQKHLADPTAAASPESARGGTPRSSKLPWAVAGTLAIALIVTAAFWWRATRPVERPLARFSVDLGPEAMAGARLTAVLSPDGTSMVFPIRTADGKQMLATRLLDRPQATALAGTEDGADPFFSPDGQWIGFQTATQLKKVAAQGGATVSLCDVGVMRGASWGEDGNIIFGAAGTGLQRVPAAGGTPQPLTKPDKGDTTHRWPQVLPGAKVVLFTGHSSGNNFDDANIEALSLKTGEIRILQRGGYFGRYLPTSGATGHLVYIHQGTLFGVPFNPARLELQGTPAPLLQDVAGSTATAGGQFSYSRDQTFVYLNGKPVDVTQTIVWLDSTGKTQSLQARPGGYFTPSFSPDGRRLAYSKFSGGAADIWVYDWQRDTPTQLTFTREPKGDPIWTPDGKHIVFSILGRDGSIWWIRADGSDQPQRLLESKNTVITTSFSPDGRHLAFQQSDPATVLDIWTLPLDLSDPDHPKPGKPEPFLRTPAIEVDAAFSTDGRWMAYASDESGAMEVFVRPFPGPGGKWRISTGGGRFPIWSRDGRELFYLASDDRIMAAGYAAKGDTFVADKPRVWSDRRILRTANARPLDVAPGGKRFAVFPRPEATEEGKGSVHVTVLLNFFDHVRRVVPAGGN